MITEFGGSNTTSCEELLAEALAYMEENDEYIGWTAWAAGPFWGPNSPCCTDSRQLGSLEPGSEAAGGGPSLYETLWLKVFQPVIPETLQWEGPARVNGDAAPEEPAPEPTEEEPAPEPTEEPTSEAPAPEEPSEEPAPEEPESEEGA